MIVWSVDHGSTGLSLGRGVSTGSLDLFMENEREMYSLQMELSRDELTALRDFLNAHLAGTPEEVAP